MRKAEIFFKGEKAGVLTQKNDGKFTFQYHGSWVLNSKKAPISLTLPKRNRVYKSDNLFPFFYNLLPEGTNKQVVCNELRIDEDDYFSLLLNTARYDAIGAVTVKKVQIKI